MQTPHPEPRPILVTGGAGFVGATLVAQLVQRGERVVVFDNFAVGRRDSLGNLDSDRLTVIEGDLCDAEQVREAVAQLRPRAVIHLAALHFIPYCSAHPVETLQVNVAGTEALLAACRQSPVERLIFVSSAAVYAPQEIPHSETDALKPDDIYGLSKLFGEHLVILFEKETSIPCVRARLFNTYGPGETNPHVVPEIIDQLRSGDELQLGTTSSYRDLIHVRDVAAAMAALLYATPPVTGAVNIGSGEEHSVEELVDLLRSELRRPLTVLHAAGRMRKVDRPHLCADITRMREALRWQPMVKLSDGLRELAEAASPVGAER